MKSVTGIMWLLFLILSLQLGAQQFGGFPPSTKWKQINTDTARIIFTSGSEKQAERIATLIHKAAADTPFSMGPGLRKINVVLHNQTTLANGYVALAPFRSEYYLVPPSNVFEFGNIPWFENLAIHEYRHVQQYNNFRNGLSKGFYYLFGEQGLAVANSITVPDWFYEGDAVHSETALTTQGRGRLSSFLSSYNSLWLEGKKYSWMKLRNGSYKDFVPDHYQLGYLLVNYGYLKYGGGFWKKVTEDATAFKGLIYPFQRAIKKYTGENYKSFRKEALNYYKQKIAEIKETNILKNKRVTRFFFPQYINSDSLLYLKTSYKKLPAFYIRDQTGEHKIAKQSIATDEWFSYRKGKIAYTAYSTNPRWSLVDYNDIVLFDINNPVEKRITHKAKYFSPDISPSGKKIIAVNIDDSLQTELQELDSQNGAILKRKGLKSSLYYTQPRYIDEEKIVVGVRRPDATMSLQIIDLSTDSTEILIPYTNHTIGYPFIADSIIYFTANFNGNDDIYQISLTDKKIIQLTNGLTGNYYPSYFRGTLTWSKITAEGTVLKRESLKNLMHAEAGDLKGQSLIFPIALERDLTSVPTRYFPEQKYKKSTGLLHFHSLTPYYSDPEFSLSLYSDNILNTFSNEVYYLYNRNETSNAIGWNSSYGGFFPVINAGIEYIFNRTINTPGQSLTFNQFEAKLGYSIPLNFTKGKSYKFLDLGSNYVFNRTIPTGIFKDSLKADNVTYLQHFLTWSQYLPQAIQHIYPKLGYTISLNHRHLLSGSGYQFLGSTQLFLPSFGNHSIVLSGSFQETDTSNRVFVNRFAYSRGYNGYYDSRMWRLSGNYHFPIAYPDWGFGNLVYFLRLRGNIFYDFTRSYSKNKLKYRDLRSRGAELFFDTKWWNQLPVSFGFRYSYLLDYQLTGDAKSYFEVILPVNLIPRN